MLSQFSSRRRSCPGIVEGRHSRVSEMTEPISRNVNAYLSCCQEQRIPEHPSIEPFAQKQIDGQTWSSNTSQSQLQYWLGTIEFQG